MVPLLFGLAVVVFGLWMRSRAAAAATWPSVPGVMIESEVGKSPSCPDYYARILYRYQVDGQTYESRQFSYTGTATSLTWVSSVVERYPLGSTVTVYYDPRSPGTAVLENNQNALWLGVVIFGLVFVGIGLFHRA